MQIRNTIAAAACACAALFATASAATNTNTSAATYSNSIAAGTAGVGTTLGTVACLGAPICGQTATATQTPVAGPDINSIHFAGLGVAEASAVTTPTVFGPSGVGVSLGASEYAGYAALGFDVAQETHLAGHETVFSIGGGFAPGTPAAVIHAGVQFGF